MSRESDLLARLEKLIDIGIALSAEKDIARLLEKILTGAKILSNADGGTLYSMQDNDTVKMEILLTTSLDYAMGGTTGEPIPFPPIPLHKDGQPNYANVVTYAVLTDRTVNIEDAYNAEGFDFSGTRAFDQRTGYRSTSFLTVPMKNYEGDTIGVIQLLNAQDERTGKIIPFSADVQRLVEALTSQAAIALTNQRLIIDLKRLFESLIQLIATAIDDKSPYTGGHCRRVPELALMLADAAVEVGEGPLAGFDMTAEQRYELEIAAWLHDCGKIVTPEHVVDKATKLETIYDRIEAVAARFAAAKREAENTLLRRKLAALETADPGAAVGAEQEYRETCRQLDEGLAFVRRANVGGEFMRPEDQDRIRAIARLTWTDTDGVTRGLLSDNEVYNLNIAKGTLTAEEREVINYHITATIKMLEALPLPKHLSHVPEFAGGHHERVDGKGYPRGLTREQMSLQARMMAIADIFEALTASDRPYKQPKTLSESLRIMSFMKKEQHIDPDLFDLFVREKVYLKYAQRFLRPEQVDAVDPAVILR